MTTKIENKITEMLKIRNYEKLINFNINLIKLDELNMARFSWYARG